MTNPNATTATYTQIVVPIKEDAILFEFGVMRDRGEPYLVKPDMSGESLQLTFQVCGAGKTIPWVLTQDDFELSMAEFPYPGRISVDYHSFNYRKGT